MRFFSTFTPFTSFMRIANLIYLLFYKFILFFYLLSILSIISPKNISSDNVKFSLLFGSIFLLFIYVPFILPKSVINILSSKKNNSAFFLEIVLFSITIFDSFFLRPMIYFL